MVIAGAGGAGKTVLALELVLGLLNARAPGDPVPVRISAPTWKTGDSIGVWLVQHLVAVYRMSPASAESVVHANLVIPVVDGLDEMDSGVLGYGSRSAKLVAALNSFQDLNRRAPIIVTCRTTQLEALIAARVWVHDSATIEIEPVSPAKAQLYLKSEVVDVERWQPVLSKLAFEPNGALATALSTPWRLSLVRRIYEWRDPDGNFSREPVDVVSVATGGSDAVRDHLLALLIPAAVIDSKTCSYAPAQVERWLTTLACEYLSNLGGTTVGGVTVSGTDVVPHRLWPLAGVRRVRAVTMLIAWVLLSTALCGELVRADPRLSAAYVATVGGFGSAVLATSMLFVLLNEVEPHRFVWTFTHKVGGRKQLRRAITAALLLWAGVIALGFAMIALSDRVVASWAWGAVPACGAAFAVAALTRDDASVAARHPREVVAADVRFGVLFSGVSGALMAVLVRVAPPPPDVPDDFGLLVGPALGIVIGWTIAPTSIYYLAMLLSTRRWSRNPLPWRLVRFLDWGHDCGLLRTAGIGYQFRHREIQDYLIRQAHLSATHS
ncbi:hypothetical protein [Nocardia sp. NPDC058666]